MYFDNILHILFHLYIYFWIGVCGPLPKTLILFMTKICDFPYPIYDLTKNLIPYLWPDSVWSTSVQKPLGRVVRKLINANPRLKVNRSFQIDH